MKQDLGFYLLLMVSFTFYEAHAQIPGFRYYVGKDIKNNISVIKKLIPDSIKRMIARDNNFISNDTDYIEIFQEGGCTDHTVNYFIFNNKTKLSVLIFENLNTPDMTVSMKNFNYRYDSCRLQITDWMKENGWAMVSEIHLYGIKIHHKGHVVVASIADLTQDTSKYKIIYDIIGR